MSTETPNRLAKWIRGAVLTLGGSIVLGLAATELRTVQQLTAKLNEAGALWVFPCTTAIVGVALFIGGIFILMRMHT